MTDKNNETKHESPFRDPCTIEEKQSSESGEKDQSSLNERAVKALEIIAFAQVFPLYHRLGEGGSWHAFAEDWLRTIIVEEPVSKSPGESGN
jgi:hypothetical protein